MNSSIRIIAFLTAASILLLCLSGCSDSAGIASVSWEDYDELILKAREETDGAAREAYIHEAEDMLMDTGCISPLYYCHDVYLMSDGLTGVYSSYIGIKYFSKAKKTDGSAVSAAFYGEISSFDPALAESLAELSLAANLFAGLYGYDESGALVPTLAESTEISEDGLIYTFTLAEGLMWSDGTSLGASDVTYSWRRLVDSDTGSGYAYLLDVIARDDDGNLAVSADDETDTVLTVTLEYPCDYFLELCAFPALYAVKQSAVEYADGYTDYYGNIADVDAWTSMSGFPTSGAYKVSSSAGTVFTLAKNDNYARAEDVTATSVSFILSDDSSYLFSLYAEGSLDFLGSVTYELIAEATESGGNSGEETSEDTTEGDEDSDETSGSDVSVSISESEIYSDETASVYFLAFNFNGDTYYGMTEEDAKLLRRAILLYIDRELIVDEITGNGENVATSLIPSAISDGNGGIYRKNDESYTYAYSGALGYYDTDTEANREEAREIISSLGLDEDGDGVLDTTITLTYLTVKSTLNIKIAQSIQQDLAELGIIVRISTAEENVFEFEQSIFNYDIVASTAIACYDDAMTFLERWITDTALNYTGLGSEVVEDDANAY
ncbi:MAG: ABC transporter substrate-binding protein [Firmicutes bacterium]|nr:ABC transporter substrate-binding protein [Bacillota bacterium]